MHNFAEADVRKEMEIHGMALREKPSLETF